ncbi:hypothetical protein GGP86_003074 [Salinibacter ruber]|uniref:hypothetical protein n=1 Tax=Salinibacter ruber TaxID=146919 RepID=UPI002168FD92|nr:hypothetical protein [Salinibacter ruber]MCS3863278.1 hypothetical protein [Salinibacter ruber]
MNQRLRIAFGLVAAGLLCVAIPDAAYAYGGPGSIISGIGAFLAAVAALLAALFGFIWFPLKRLYQKMTKEDPADQDAELNPTSE